jgi:hypothetical protein
LQKVLSEVENEMVVLRAFYNKLVGDTYNDADEAVEAALNVKKLSREVNALTGEVYDWCAHPPPPDSVSLCELPFYSSFLHENVPGVAEIHHMFVNFMKYFKNKKYEDVRMYDASLIPILQLLVRFLTVITKPTVSDADVQQMRQLFAQLLSFFPGVEIPLHWSGSLVYYSSFYLYFLLRPHPPGLFLLIFLPLLLSF